MTTREALEGVRKLLSSENRWCQYEMAQTNDGSSIHPQHSDACAWCLMGAVSHICGGGLGEDSPIDDILSVNRKLRLALSALHPDVRGTVADWQDHHDRKHSDVLAVIDRAIDLS